MDETALRALLTCLEEQQSNLKHRLYFWTIMVIVGCAGELYFVLDVYFDDRKNWRKARTSGSIHFPEKPTVWKMLLEVLSVALVVIGISGELSIDRASTRLETRIRKANDDLFLLLDKEAGTAKKSSESAVKDAAKAKVDAGDAGTKAASAATVAANAASKASDLDVQLANTNMELSANKSELARIETVRNDSERYIRNVAICTSPRIIPEWFANGKTFVDAIKPLKGFKATLVVVNDPEALQAASELSYALKAVGISIRPGTIQPNETIPPGVYVESFGSANAKDIFPPPSSDASRNAAWSVVKFLHSYNWQARWLDGFSGHTEDLSPDGIRIAIGRYPTLELVTPPAMEGMQQEFADAERKFKEAFDAENDKAFADRTKGYTPDQLATAKAQREQWHKEMAKEQDLAREQQGDLQPCKVTTDHL